MKTDEKIEKTVGDMSNILSEFMTAVKNLKLSIKQINAFCDNTQDGTDLWMDYIYRATAPGVENYSFTDYVKWVLNETRCPGVMIDTDLIMPD